MAMSARALLLRHLSDLSEEDIHALLGVAERLRAKHLSPQVSAPRTAAPPGATRHPERFGGLIGSVLSSGDVQSPVADATEWTLDEGNLKP
jgi:hypothetical protein